MYDKKDKIKNRVKDFSKGTGFIKEENKFSSVVVKDNEAFLNLEESSNLQDLINFADSRIEDENKDLPIESLYSQILNNKQPRMYSTNENLDTVLVDIMQSRIPESEKTFKVLQAYGELAKRLNKTLSEQTYLDLVQLFIKNGNLEYASYFLCQMDRLKIKIPRRILDLFLESNIAQKAFESKKEKKTKERKEGKNVG